MKNQVNIKLIEGSFQPSEAGKVLFSLLNSKINYHNLELFSAQERSDGNVEHSKLRIQYLKNASEELSDLIKEASENKYHFEIVGNIQIILKK
ncbi:hypothetical protein [Flavobacterium sp.]|uniref:hypothetical protein n=1 Tax=Flavobacterium sp. TaxID=239 RepID=UPI00286C9158|nr:hypothetical protein [Flavobacterium sp.]